VSDFVRILPAVTARRLRFVFDPWLFSILLSLLAFGLVVLWSAASGNEGLFRAQCVRIALGLGALVVVAQVPIDRLRMLAVPLYCAVVVLLVLVLFTEPVKGSRRWLEIPGLTSFQPSEMAKVAVPLMVAVHLERQHLPPALPQILQVLALIGVPVALIVVEPDLGTGLLVAAAGGFALLFAGLQLRWLVAAGLAIALVAPLWWEFGMEDYQRERVRTLFDPGSDPLGAGWNTIQATTAIGSGGILGKGLFSGTQSHLDFLPEASTDFIFAVLAEELGLAGILLLLMLYLMVVARGLSIAIRARDMLGRLLAASLTLTFFTYAFVNIAMVSGIAPIVGVPLPLVSYGGTAMTTLLGSFGLVMAAAGTRRAWRP
jgi:rod shape determining protein RodA